MSTNELSELIALGCPDLVSTTASNGGSSIPMHIVDEKRRLSVKQMTATELAAARAAAALEIKNALIKAKELGQVKSAPTTPLPNTISNTSFKNETPATSASAPTTPLTLMPTAPAVNNKINNNTRATTNVTPNHSSPSPSPSEAHWEDKIRNLPVSSAPRDRLTSLPSILDDGIEEHFLALSSVASKPMEISSKSQNSIEELNPTESESSDSLLHHDDDISSSPRENQLEISSSNTSVHNSMIDSIELMRQQRRDRENPREKRSGSEPDERRLYNERSAAPDRLHSSSISSIASAAGAISATGSLNPSKNHSRRNSNASVISDISTTVNVVVPPTLPLYPLAKTVSAPNMERRKSSLSTLFPGPSPLMVAEPPLLHTDPKVREEFSKEDIDKNVQAKLNREIPAGKQVHRTKTPPPVGVSLGVNLKKVTPPRSHITVKKNDAPMLGVVLRKVERKVVPQKSILDDDKPLYKISIVRSDGKEHKASDQSTKPKPKPVPLQKSATVAAKPNPGGILTGPQGTRPAHYPAPQLTGKPQRPALGVPITIQKIEGDKIIIIKKYIVPKNTKLPEHLLKIGVRIQCLQCGDRYYMESKSFRLICYVKKVIVIFFVRFNVKNIMFLLRKISRNYLTPYK